jgi:hypothetical protein
VGLATIAMGVQRLGGSSDMPVSELDRRLDLLAAGVETGAGAQVGGHDFVHDWRDEHAPHMLPCVLLLLLSHLRTLTLSRLLCELSLPL